MNHICVFLAVVVHMSKCLFVFPGMNSQPHKQLHRIKCSILHCSESHTNPQHLAVWLSQCLVWKLILAHSTGVQVIIHNATRPFAMSFMLSQIVLVFCCRRTMLTWIKANTELSPWHIVKQFLAYLIWKFTHWAAPLVNVKKMWGDVVTTCRVSCRAFPWASQSQTMLLWFVFPLPKHSSLTK